ncbi:hypothetical protein [Sorangium sp. So ce426]|uniref:hypothetical protein n=1 Tax=Sorangium sp. So ce426 TaxID=3133312 RepID=UPI003F5C6E6F
MKELDERAPAELAAEALPAGEVRLGEVSMTEAGGLQAGDRAKGGLEEVHRGGHQRR